MTDQQQHMEQKQIPPAVTHPATLGLALGGAVEVALMHTGPASLVVALGVGGLVAVGKRLWDKEEGPVVEGTITEQVEVSQAIAQVAAPSQKPRKRSMLDRATGTYYEEAPAPVSQVQQEARPPQRTQPAPLEAYADAEETRVVDEFSVTGMERLYRRDEQAPALAPFARAAMANASVAPRESAIPAPLASARRQVVTFSSILQSTQWVPTKEQIYLGERDGRPVFSSVEDMQHVAIAGKTGNGKSSIERLILAQLCYTGTQVLLLNPHFTKYDLKSNEDWTPFLPFLANDPMVCVGNYAAIEHYLRWAAEVELPKRIHLHGHSIWWGDPIYLVIDELPSVIREIPKSAEYMRKILEEGRKVGIFLMSASHNFMVKTISPKDGGGSIRLCYNLIYYAGGDPITVTELLNLKPDQVPENALGRGRIMLRCGTLDDLATPQRSTIALMDNDALYMLLGPSTYDPREAQAMAERMSAPVPAYAGATAQPIYHEPRVFPTAKAPASSAPARRTALPAGTVLAEPGAYSPEHRKHVKGETSAQRIQRLRAAALGNGAKDTPLLDVQEKSAPAPAHSATPAPSRKGVYSRIAKKRIFSASEVDFLMLVLRTYQEQEEKQRGAVKIAQLLTSQSETGEVISKDMVNAALCDLEDLGEIPRRPRY